MVITALISVMPDIIDKVTGKHRGFGHSFIFLAPAILAFMINIFLGLSIVSAFITHVALAMLVIFCLVPVAYGLMVGMPDPEEIWAQGEELENETENNSTKEYIKRDYRRYYSP
ncbi:MAG: hypothetical protein KUA29_05445, partial [Methanobacterium sp.]|nr:hypothetical protein [Methanobacterium sp.]